MGYNLVLRIILLILDYSVDIPGTTVCRTLPDLLMTSPKPATCVCAYVDSKPATWAHSSDTRNVLNHLYTCPVKSDGAEEILPSTVEPPTVLIPDTRAPFPDRGSCWDVLFSRSWNLFREWISWWWEGRIKAGAAP